MKSRAVFAFQGRKVEIQSETVKLWMSFAHRGHLEIDPSQSSQAEAMFDYLTIGTEQFCAKDISLLEQMSPKQFASLFTVYDE